MGPHRPIVTYPEYPPTDPPAANPTQTTSPADWPAWAVQPRRHSPCPSVSASSAVEGNHPHQSPSPHSPTPPPRTSPPPPACGPSPYSAAPPPLPPNHRTAPPATPPPTPPAPPAEDTPPPAH